ncbi:hypothetical protein EV644_105210 [Kribbella orskensis]|uniref:Uncharacterized protein n=1 Tax=Kribbella orskensis TaxID=2512216 RepID=A0ABY2BLD1_9ACTN|nr:MULTISPECIES: hypothetical protein [Kribbella]TCN40925.1 hypothetical protein EV642_104210 [Kribbella sp. VKM Ac-2500]TCO24177.1 hypothetical protein EV644_105210 [Kribbella orskensis]
MITDNDSTHDDSTERALGNDPEAPHRALSPLTNAEAAHLVRLSLEAAAERSLPAGYDGTANLRLHPTSAAFPTPGDTGLAADLGVGSDPDAAVSMVAGLSNLARIVAGERRDRWPQVVGEHFDQLASTLRHGPPPLPADPRRELYQRLTPSNLVQPSWTSQAPEFVPGLLSVPATYTDGTITMYFDPSDLGMTWSEAEQAGLHNLRGLTDTVEYAEHDGTTIAMLSGSVFTASRALVLDTVLRESLHVENPQYGVLAAMPVRGLLLVHVITSLRVIPALGMMLNFAGRAHATEPGPLSPWVYLVTPEGRWHPAIRQPEEGRPPGLSPALLALAHHLGRLE